jgi:hypothetical protein
MSKKSGRSCILIAGMHRSGTSALSRVLNLVGCTHPQNLVEANYANASGYWESERLSLFNDDILKAAGSSWDDWANYAPDWIDSPMMGTFARQATKLYSEEFGDADLTVFKDPRLCRLLPFWLPILQSEKIDPYVILPIRNPNEVAASLTKRNGLDHYYGHLFWLRHILDGEIGSRGLKRAFVTYNDLMESYSIVLTTTEQNLGIKWPRRSARTSEEIEAYLSEKLRHERASDKAILSDASTLDWLRQTYEIMLRWAEKGEDAADYATLDTILVEFNDAAKRFGRLVFRGKNALAELIEVNKVVIERDQQLAARDAVRVKLEKENVEQRGTIAQRDLALQARQNELGGIYAEATNLREQLAQKDQELAAAEQNVEKSMMLYEAEKAAAKEQVRRIQTELDQVLKVVVEMEAGNVSLVQSFNDKLSQSEAEKAAAAQQIEEMQTKLDDAIKAHQALETKNIDLAKGFRDTFALAEQDNEELTQRLRSAESALEELEKSRRADLYELNQAKSSLAQKKAEADDYYFQAKRYEDEKAELVQAISDLQSEIDASIARGRRLAVQIETMVVAMDQSSKLPLLPKRFTRSKNQRILSGAQVVDQDWYLRVYPDVSALGIDATLHYVTHGASEGRSPNPEHHALKNKS